jgi:hypothetical protein
MRRSLPFIFLLFLGLSSLAEAQTPADKSALEKERQQIQNELK